MQSLSSRLPHPINGALSIHLLQPETWKLSLVFPSPLPPHPPSLTHIHPINVSCQVYAHNSISQLIIMVWPPLHSKPLSSLAWKATTIQLSPSFYFSLPPTQFTLHTAVNVSLLCTTLQWFNDKSPFLDTALYALAPACLPTSSRFSFRGWLFQSQGPSFSSSTHPKLTFFRALAHTDLYLECLCRLFPRLSPHPFDFKFSITSSKKLSLAAPSKVALILSPSPLPWPQHLLRFAIICLPH